MTIRVPFASLVVLVGPSGTGKSFWCGAFPESYTVSSDTIREMLTDDGDNQYANGEVFDLFYTIIRKRLLLGRPTFADSTGLDDRTRNKLLEIAQEAQVPAYLMLMDVPLEKALEWNSQRSRQVPGSSIRKQFARFEEVKKQPVSEAWAGVFTPQKVVFELPYSIDIPEPYFVIGDVHGEYGKLVEINNTLPAGVRIYTGDVVDRGPDVRKCVNYIMDQVNRGEAYCVLGNHDWKAARAMRGNKVERNADLNATLDDLKGQNWNRYADFLFNLPPYLVINDKVIVTHAGLKKKMIGSTDKRTRDFCIYGKFIGRDDDGNVMRQDWAQDYDGEYTIIYGHTVMPEVRFLRNTVCVDTGACFPGGKLSAVCVPTMEVISV